MSASEKMTEVTAQAKAAAAKDKKQLDKAAREAEAFARKHAGDARAKIAEARHHAPKGKH